MNYYQHHIGDYAAATAHLSLIEDAIYSRLLRRYYLQESPLPADVKQVARLAGARSADEIEAAQAVLSEFFTLTDEGWRNKRADEEIAAYHAKAETARDNGKRGGRPAKEPKKTDPVSTENPAETNRVFLANPEETGSKANQEPRTNNQEPVEAKARAGASAASGSRLAADWSLPDDWRQWAEAERPEIDASAEAAKFADYWHAQAGVKGRKADWLAVWRNWIRNSRPPAGKPTLAVVKPSAAADFRGTRYESTPDDQLPVGLR